MNSFSIKRVCQLLRVELMFEGKGLLIALLAPMVVLILAQLSDTPDFTYDLTSRVLSRHLHILLLVFGVIFFAKVHSLLHAPNTLPYVAVPATPLEKYLMIFLLGIIYFIIPMVVTQVNLWVEAALFPIIDYSPDSNPWSANLLINGTLFLNPVVLLEREVASFFTYIIGLLLLISVWVPRKGIAVPLYFIVPAGILYGLTQLFNALQWNRLDSSVNNENLVAIIAAAIGIAAFIGAYFVLRRKEVKS